MVCPFFTCSAMVPELFDVRWSWGPHHRLSKLPGFSYTNFECTTQCIQKFLAVPPTKKTCQTYLWVTMEPFTCCSPACHTACKTSWGRSTGIETFSMFIESFTWAARADQKWFLIGYLKSCCGLAPNTLLKKCGNIDKVDAYWPKFLNRKSYIVDFQLDPM